MTAPCPGSCCSVRVGGGKLWWYWPTRARPDAGVPHPDLSGQAVASAVAARCSAATGFRPSRAKHRHHGQPTHATMSWRDISCAHDRARGRHRRRTRWPSARSSPLGCPCRRYEPLSPGLTPRSRQVTRYVRTALTRLGRAGRPGDGLFLMELMVYPYDARPSSALLLRP